MLEALPESGEPRAIFRDLVFGKIATSWNLFDQVLELGLIQSDCDFSTISTVISAQYPINRKIINSVMGTYFGYANVCKPVDGTADIDYIVNLIMKQFCLEAHFVSIVGLFIPNSVPFQIPFLS